MSFSEMVWKRAGGILGALSKRKPSYAAPQHPGKRTFSFQMCWNGWGRGNNYCWD